MQADKVINCPRCFRAREHQSPYRTGQPAPVQMRRVDPARRLSGWSCPSCDGAWVELSRLDDWVNEVAKDFASRRGFRTQAAHAPVRPKAFVASVDSRRPLNPSEVAIACPDCQRDMIRYEYKKSRIFLDLCMPCAHVWLDVGELASAGRWRANNQPG